VAREPMPIDEVLPALLAALRRLPSAVPRAPTSAGKTTCVPPARISPFCECVETVALRQIARWISLAAPAAGPGNGQGSVRSARGREMRSRPIPLFSLQ
jgi:hypothetical protein